MRRRQFTAYVEALTSNRRPRRSRPSEEDAAAMRAAITLRAAGTKAAAPAPGFVERLEESLRKEGDGRDSVVQVSRRWVLQGAGLAAAAGAGAAVAIDRLVVGVQAAAPPAHSQLRLSPDKGKWQNVASRASLADGTVRRFSSSVLVAYVTDEGGTLRAVSGVCSHQGCLLQYNNDARRLDCPCHRAAFSLEGDVLFAELPTPPRSLPRIQVRDENGQVQVFVPVQV